MPDAMVSTDGFEVTSSSQTAEQMTAAFAAEPKLAKPAAEPAEAASEQANEAEAAPAKVEPEPSPESEAGKVLAAKKNTLEGRKRSIQAEIDDLTRQKHETRREAEMARQEVAALRRELDGLRPKPVTAPEGEPTPDQFETYEAYVKAEARWGANQTLAAERNAWQQQQQFRAQHDLKTALDARVEKFKADHADYHDVVDSAQIAPDAPAYGAIMAHLQHSDLGPHLAYELGQHPEELARIAALPPGFAVAALGRLEAKIEARLVPATSGPDTKPPAVTAAKPPIKPVGSSPVASDDGEVPDDLSLDDHIGRMNRREHKPLPRRRL